jgi:hypothetical protein
MNNLIVLASALYPTLYLIKILFTLAGSVPRHFRKDFKIANQVQEDEIEGFVCYMGSYTHTTAISEAEMRGGWRCIVVDY